MALAAAAASGRRPVPGDPQVVFLLIPGDISPPEHVNASLDLFATKALPRFS
jgi:hypothetical protein